MNRQQIFLTICVFLSIISISKSVCPAECVSCNSNTYSRTWQYSSGLARQHCTQCASIPHLTPNLPLCRCDNGYFFDGTDCVEHIIGTIHKEDFEGTLDNWIKGASKTFISLAITTDPEWDGNVGHFTNNQTGGDAFFKKSFQTLKWSEKIWLSFDYKDNIPASDSCIQMGWGNSQQNPGAHNWQVSGCTYSNPDYFYYEKSNADGQWQHFEVIIPVYYEEVANFFIQNPWAPGRNVVKFDNWAMSSIHGHTGTTFSAHKHNQPTIQILSVHYDGYGGELDAQQFNFFIKDMDESLGNNTWDNQILAARIQGLEEVVQVVLHRSNNGVELGDAYGRFVDNSAYTSKRYFIVGDFLIFNKDQTENISDFVLEDGNEHFLGPFKIPQSYLQTCFDHCKDYATFEEAALVCQQDNQCDGIKFTHSLWGGLKSTGFEHLSKYGYQLRRSQKEDTSNMLNTGARVCEFSYHKRQSAKFQKATDGVYCSYKCASCSNTSIWVNEFKNSIMDIKECSACNLSLNDPNRNTTGDCSCKTGFYDDGNQCQKQKIGEIYFEQFIDSNWIDNWQPKFEKPTTILTTKYGKSCIQFTSGTTGADIIHKKMYQNIKYGKAYIILEYVDEGNTQFYFGVGNSYPGDHTFIGASESINDANFKNIPQTSGGWGYLEAQVDLNPDIPYSFIIQDSLSNQGLYLSSYKLVSSHGLPEFSKSGYAYLQPGIQILSIEYEGYMQTVTAIQQFGFNKSDLQNAIGRIPVHEEQFAVYIEGKNVIAEIQIFLDTNNGQSLGDSYGRFVNNNNYTGIQHFLVGEWIIFDSNLSQNKSDFVLKSGTCSFDGPFKHQNQNLETCFNNCQDFETLGEAMQECLLHDTCDGITYSHYLWGGSNSQGFQMGYGFQLRQQGTSQERDFPRNFEHSWRKNLQKYKYQKGTSFDCTDCPIKCEYCNTDESCSSCYNSTRQNSPTCECVSGQLEINQPFCGCDIECQTCQGLPSICLVCNGSNRDADNFCKCVDTFYQEENISECQPCQHPCELCESQQVCKTCVTGSNRLSFPTCECEPGYVENDSLTCEKCDKQCETCKNTTDQCEICYDLTRQNPPICNCIEGFYHTGNESCEKCHKKCNSCESLETQCTQCGQNRYNPPLCPCNLGYYEADNNNCIECKNICSICNSLNDCISCSNSLRSPPSCDCNIGYYENLETNLCESCDKKCQQCQVSAQTCIICSIGVGRNLEVPNCNCKKGYYEKTDQLNCEKCPSQCQECQDNQICTICTNPNANLPFCKSDTLNQLFFYSKIYFLQCLFIQQHYFFYLIFTLYFLIIFDI